MDLLGRFILGKNLFLAKSFFEVLVIKGKICLSKWHGEPIFLSVKKIIGNSIVTYNKYNGRRLAERGRSGDGDKAICFLYLYV